MCARAGIAEFVVLVLLVGAENARAQEAYFNGGDDWAEAEVDYRDSARGIHRHCIDADEGAAGCDVGSAHIPKITPYFAHGEASSFAGPSTVHAGGRFGLFEPSTSATEIAFLNSIGHAGGFMEFLDLDLLSAPVGSVSLMGTYGVDRVPAGVSTSATLEVDGAPACTGPASLYLGSSSIRQLYLANCSIRHGDRIFLDFGFTASAETVVEGINPATTLSWGSDFEFWVKFLDGAGRDISARVARELATPPVNFPFAIGRPASSTTPEPASLALLSSGLLGIVGLRRRKRRPHTNRP